MHVDFCGKNIFAAVINNISVSVTKRNNFIVIHTVDQCCSAINFLSSFFLLHNSHAHNIFTLHKLLWLSAKRRTLASEYIFVRRMHIL